MQCWICHQMLLVQLSWLRDHLVLNWPLLSSEFLWQRWVNKDIKCCILVWLIVKNYYITAIDIILRVMFLHRYIHSCVKKWCGRLCVQWKGIEDVTASYLIYLIWKFARFSFYMLVFGNSHKVFFIDHLEKEQYRCSYGFNWGHFGGCK